MQTASRWCVVKRLFDSLLFLQAGNVPFVRVGSVICEFGESNFYPIGLAVVRHTDWVRVTVVD
ncbi:MAG: hypothetical protein MUF45_05545 [Spirosomaceae bacterium]|nr:hypothetical protein [Spirosomataceae bacterium]